MNELKKIESSLEQLHDEFNKQVEALGNDSKEFHTALIKLSAKYPDHTELIQFIVFINDKIETNQSLFQDVVVESFNELVKVKKELVAELIDQQELKAPKKKKSFKLIQTPGFWKDMKMLFIALAFIIGTLGIIYAPSAFTSVISAYNKTVAPVIVPSIPIKEK